MQTHQTIVSHRTIQSRLRRAGLGLLAVLALAACGAPPANLPTQTSAAPTAAALPTAAQPVSTAAALPTATQTAPTPAALTPTLPAATQTSPAASTGCTAPAVLTPAVTEGPYFKAGSPERASLMDPGLTGTPLTITGYVLTTDCKPVAHALLEFWQANAQGQYDNSGYTLRGHQYADTNGRYQLLTVNPGLYPGRTEHIHVKVQAPGGPVLTSQLFFPNVAGNSADSIFTPALLVKYQGDAASGQAQFNFIISSK
jgi:protocatechuate 3,4-dioxygenase beta subunit